jgi:hypothetical protein
MMMEVVELDAVLPPDSGCVSVCIGTGPEVVVGAGVVGEGVGSGEGWRWCGGWWSFSCE